MLPKVSPQISHGHSASLGIAAPSSPVDLHDAPTGQSRFVRPSKECHEILGQLPHPVNEGRAGAHRDSKRHNEPVGDPHRHLERVGTRGMLGARAPTDVRRRKQPDNRSDIRQPPDCQARPNLGHLRSMSKPPPGGGARVGRVCAIRTGADGTAEMLAELGMVLTDPGYRVADRAGHSDSSTLGRRCGSSITTTQANRSRELSNEEVALGIALRGPFSVPDGARLLDVVFDLGEASAVGVLGSRVEDLARVAECRARQGGRLAAAVYLRTPPDPWPIVARGPLAPNVTVRVTAVTVLLTHPW